MVASKYCSEMYHATPETQVDLITQVSFRVLIFLQTDDSYHHPEDLEHFDKHESIEAEEQRRERKFTGLSEKEMVDLLQASVVNGKTSQNTKENTSGDAEASVNDTSPKQSVQIPAGEQEILQQALSAAKPKYTRDTPPEELEPSEKYADALKNRESQAEWGKGKDGYKRPKTPADKMR